jgi:sugar transferase (PEP-CTERM system associated)
MLFSIFIVTLSFYYCDLYDLRIVRNFSEFTKRLPRALVIAFVSLYIFYLFFPLSREILDSNPFWLLLIYTVSVILTVRLALYLYLTMHALRDRVVILGTGPIAWKVSEAIEANPHVGYTIIGFVDDRRASSQSDPQSSKYVVIGSLDRLREILDERRPDRIIIALGERRGCLPVRDLLNARMAGCVVEDAIEVHERLTKKLAIESLAPSYLLFSEDFTASRLQITLRRLVSLAFALVGLILTAPLMLLLAVVIKMDSNGPVFFIQDRCGRHGRTFRLFKFRTMHPVQPGTESETVWERDDSLRVTRVGKWLRKLRLDEIPQFINVLRGDMDLIGPRPEMASNVKTMLKEIPYYSLRMGVRPGITGWAQVRHGYSVSHEDVTEKMRYDLYYVKHMSLWLDLRILLDTVKIVLLGWNSEKNKLLEIKEANQPLTSSGIVTLLQSEKSTGRGWE